MSNLVLYRKYRPKTFKEMMGQEHIITTLTNALKQDKVSHAYLFSGPHGIGKTTTARLLAKALNCESRGEGQAEPCNKCDSCREINRGSAIDVIEIDAASNRGIEEVRELKEGIRFNPAKSKYKVIIIDECHQLSKPAANALLKMLEEPPSHVLFVLATTEIYKMLPTILSRCQRFDFHKLTLFQLVQQLKFILKQEQISFDEHALKLIAVQAGGAVRDAESILDEVVSFGGGDQTITKQNVTELLGIADKTAIFKFLNFLSQNQAKQAVQFLNKLLFQGIDLKEFTGSIIKYLRQIFLLKIGSEIESPLLAAFTKEERVKLNQLARIFSQTRLREMLQVLNQAENKIKYASIPQLPLELAVVEICQED